MNKRNLAAILAGVAAFSLIGVVSGCKPIEKVEVRSPFESRGTEKL